MSCEDSERRARLAMFREAINCKEARVNLDEILTEIIDALLDDDDPGCDKALLDS